MTNTYLIHAWCDRPFITRLFPVEAETPEAAIAVARRQQKQLLDAAEDCNRNYPWDEFAAYDEDGNELLYVLDDEARLRKAAPDLLTAQEYAIEYLKANDSATKLYSVLLLYPDYANVSGTETFYVFVEAVDPIEAVTLAQRDAVASQDGVAADPEDFAPLLVTPGHNYSEALFNK